MLATLSIWPYGKESLSGDVAKALQLIEESGLSYGIHAMGTNIEGEWDEVMSLIKRCRDTLLETNDRIGLIVVIDEEREATDQMAYKVGSVERKLGKTLRRAM